MGRKIIDVWPVLSITPENSVRSWTREEAENACRELNEALKSLRTPYRLQIGFDFHEDARCEHCNNTWTAAGADFNDGCCSKDEANDPERLKELCAAAEEVENDDLYTMDEDGKPSRVPVSWAATLGGAAAAWLKAGRPASEASKLIPLIQRVKSTEWCTVWKDPGVSGASLAKLPDEVRRDYRPEHLADDLLSLIDDMGLLPAREAA